MGAGIVGWEADFGFTPEFFESGDGDFDIGVGNFDYWRGTAGVTFRW